MIVKNLFDISLDLKALQSLVYSNAKDSAEMSQKKI